jgi:hypothetical protein
MKTTLVLATLAVSTLSLAACAPGNVTARGSEEGRYYNTRTADYSGEGAQSAAPVLEQRVTK